MKFQKEDLVRNLLTGEIWEVIEPGKASWKKGLFKASLVRDSTEISWLNPVMFELVQRRR
jgi:hypothetical protein